MRLILLGTGLRSKIMRLESRENAEFPPTAWVEVLVGKREAVSPENDVWYGRWLHRVFVVGCCQLLSVVVRSDFGAKPDSFECVLKRFPLSRRVTRCELGVAIDIRSQEICWTGNPVRTKLVEMLLPFFF